MLKKKGRIHQYRRSNRTAKQPVYFLLFGALFLVALVYGAFFLKDPDVRTPQSTPTPVTAASFSYLKQSPPAPTGLNPNFLNQVTACVLPTATVYGYDLYIVAGFRSYAEQDALYNQGRTVDGHIVTNAQGGQSMHNFGYAVDLADHVYGENIDYAKLGNIAAWCGLEHGDRGYTDLPHFEYRGGLSQEEFQGGMRPSPLTLPCSLLATRANADQSLSLADLHSCGAPDFNTEAENSEPSTNSSQD